MKFRFNKKEALKTLVWLLVLALGIAFYYKRIYGSFALKDGLFLSGLFFMCMSLFRVVRHLEFFNTAIYGAKKLASMSNKEESFLDYHEYFAENPYTKSFVEMLLISILAMAIGMI